MFKNSGIRPLNELYWFTPNISYFFLSVIQIALRVMFDNNTDDFSWKWNVLPSCGLHPSGRADNDQWHGEPSECHLPGHGARQLDQAGVPLHVRPGPVVHWPAGQDQGAGKLVSGLRLALCSVAGWLLQPAVLPHSHHADYGSKVRLVCIMTWGLQWDRKNVVSHSVSEWQEWVAPGPHVSAVWRHQEEPRGLQRPTTWRGLRTWAVHGGCTLGHTGTWVTGVFILLGWLRTEVAK